jgi:hypothetical protein
METHLGQYVLHGFLTEDVHPRNAGIDRLWLHNVVKRVPFDCLGIARPFSNCTLSLSPSLGLSLGLGCPSANPRTVTVRTQVEVFALAAVPADNRPIIIVGIVIIAIRRLSELPWIR